jgi:endonuclease YncB( thermonuclease family)
MALRREAGGVARRPAWLVGVLVAGLVLAAIAGLVAVDAARRQHVGGTTEARGVVTHVVDGDTIDVGGVGRVRLIGIDTPERGECGHDEATRELERLVLDETVVLRSGAQEDEDRYGRLLRYVEVGGTDVGLVLLEDGRAAARYDSRDGYGPHLRERRYVRADEGAPQVCPAPP